MRFAHYHDEVLAGLTAIGRPQRAAKMSADRRSKMTYTGVRVPDRRKLVCGGFSFFELSEPEITTIWNDIFMHSHNGDVLFCAIDYFRLRVQKHVSPDLWLAIREWVRRVDNWAHADDLSWVYSYVIQANFHSVYADLLKWNKEDELWPKRVSIVSLIHYTGKNAVFLPPDVVLPMVQRCIDDHRHYIQKATGWVLREMHRSYPQEIETFLTDNLASIGHDALARAVEHGEPERRRVWQESRNCAARRLLSKS